MTTKLQLPSLVAVSREVRRLAEENPDYVCPEGFCTYTSEGQGSCIVGQAFLNLGTAYEIVHGWDFSAGGFPEGISLILRDLSEDYGMFAGEDVEYWGKFLSRVQVHQDMKVPWGLAVSKAEEDIELAFPE